MQNIKQEEKQYFKIKRYMDDILCIYTENDKWDHTKFLRDLCKSEVYVAPLKLEELARFVRKDVTPTDMICENKISRRLFFSQFIDFSGGAATSCTSSSCPVVVSLGYV